MWKQRSVCLASQTVGRPVGRWLGLFIDAFLPVGLERLPAGNILMTTVLLTQNLALALARTVTLILPERPIGNILMTTALLTRMAR